MGRWRTSTEQWLLSEQQDMDDAADAAFAQAFAALPNVEPSAGFVQRATEAAWLARERQRLGNATRDVVLQLEQIAQR